MNTIIASVYEVIAEIGSGGGGIIYLANHMRLGKKVVLKADKRNLITSEELLRREVDVLKNLNHPYIPQVYDYFVEDDIVYTVMEYIEGESLDKPLKRGERFSQPQVIKWMVQLLDALDYLHSPIHGIPPRGFVHSDIKPANLMRRSNDDICLIDFNIALALGETQAIGRSIGYASPEHYGLDFSSGSSDSLDTEKTETIGRENSSGAVSNSSTIKKIVPDVRSDIYSAGATFYHLLSGKKPAKNAQDVVPLSSEEYSAAIVELFKKAMSPNPDLRYQTASEMRNVLLHLRETDRRAVRLRKQKHISSAVLAVLITLGIFTGYVGLRRMQVRESILKNIEYARTAYEGGDTQKALELILQAYPEEKGLFAVAPVWQAEQVLAEILGVYDLSDGLKTGETVQLPSEPLDLRISPGGSTAAFVCKNSVAVVDLYTAQVLDILESEQSILAEAEYLNENTIVYAGADGLTVYNLADKKELWRGRAATNIAVSGDHGTISAVYKDETFACIYDVETGEEKERIDFGEYSLNNSSDHLFSKASDCIFELNEDGSLMAASFSDNSLRLYRLNAGTGGEVELIPSGAEYGHYEGGFYQKYFAFTATRKDLEESAFVIVDTEKMEQTAGIASSGYYFTDTDLEGILLGKNNLLVEADPLTGGTSPLIDTVRTVNNYCRNGRYTLITSGNTIVCFDKNAVELCSLEKEYSCDFVGSGSEKVILASKNASAAWILDYRVFPEKEVLEYDAAYIHHLARISGDQSKIVLAEYNQFRIYDMEGNIISDVAIPDAEEVYSQQMIRDETDSYFQIVYKNGLVQIYNVEDGLLIEEKEADLPDLSLYQEFETKEYRIEVPLREKPKVYEKDTDKLIAELTEDAYLINIFDADNYIVVQYMTANGEIYGVLMDQKCRTLAYIPGLCDVMENVLYLDYPSGHIRRVKIYELNELLEKAKGEVKGEK